jgi:hypothetical protein
MDKRKRFSVPLAISRGTYRFAICMRFFIYRYVYDYIIKLCRQQAEVIQNHGNENVHYIGQGEARYRKYKRLKLGGCHVHDCSSV